MIFFSRCCPVSKEVYENGCTFSETHDVPPGHRATHPTKYYRKETAELLNKSVRQVRRMKWKVLASGIVGLVHGNTGRHAWNKLDASTVERIVTLYTTKYQGFNCLHFRDMLEEHEGILVKRELLRLIFLSIIFPEKT